MVSALMALLLLGAVSFNVIVVSAILAESLELAKGGRRGVGPSSRAPSIVRALEGD